MQEVKGYFSCILIPTQLNTCKLIFLRFFWCGPFLKSLLNMFQYCFCFMFWSLGSKAWEILAPKTGIETVPPGMEGEVWTTELSGKSLNTCKFKMHFCQSPNSALVLDNMLISMENQKTRTSLYVVWDGDKADPHLKD